MTIKWTENATVKLVILYGRYECLRNPFHPDFNKQLCCYKAYKQIVQCMNIPGLTVCDCVKRISFVKKQYCFELSKISSAISRGSFYKPKASWFEMMHELLFPYIQSESDYNEDSKKDCNCSQDEEGNGDRCESESQPIDECECPPCECPPADNLEPQLEPEIEPYADVRTFLDFPPKKQPRPKSRVSKNRGSSKSPTRFASSNYLDRDSLVDLKRLKAPLKFNKQGKTLDQTNHGTNTKKTTCDRGNEVLKSISSTKFAQASKRCVDASNRTVSPYVSQCAAQTERKPAINIQTSFNRAEKAQSTMNYEPSAEDVCVDSAEDRARKYKHHDEFDMFGKSIACQLRSLSLESAINLEKRIQDMMTEERLCCMKDSTAATTCSNECDCDCNDCKECCNSEKDQTCACGLAVNKCLPSFPFKTSQCYGFGCN